MNRKVMATFGIAGAAIVTAVIVMMAVSPGLVNTLFAKDNIGASKPPVVMNENVKALNDAYRAVSEATVPTVVSISVVIDATGGGNNSLPEEFKDFFEFHGMPDPQGPQQSEGAGSGVIISDDGYIITNNHVVDKAKSIKVTTGDQKEYKAKLIGVDPLTDLAVIKIEAKSLPVAHFASIDNVKVGDMVVAVGNPLGLTHTITAGIISAIGRGQLSGLSKGGYSVENFIQTDAAINPGNSGGGLFNLEGSLVGINTAIATRTGGYMGYGFAIPVDLVKAVVIDLIEDGKVDRGYIGVQIETVDEVIAKSVGLDQVAGAMVQGVLPGSPAKNAGIEMGDVILEVDGKKVNASNELQSIVAKKKAGDEVSLTLWRDGKKINKKVTLKAKENDELTDNSPVKGESEELEKEESNMKFDALGFTVQPLTAEIKKNFDISYGVYISAVERFGIAFNRRLAPDGVIYKVDKQEINSVKDFKKVLENKGKGQAVILYVKYKDTSRIIALEIPS
jgi:serine protease Do